MLRDRGALTKEKCDVTGEYKAVHGETFLSSWLREERKDREGRIMGMDKEKRRAIRGRERREERMRR